MEARAEPDGSLVLTRDSTRWGKVVLAATALLRDRSGLSLTRPSVGATPWSRNAIVPADDARGA